MILQQWVPLTTWGSGVKFEYPISYSYTEDLTIAFYSNELCFTEDQDLCIRLVLTTLEIARVLDLNKKAQGQEHSSIECDDKSHFKLTIYLDTALGYRESKSMHLWRIWECPIKMCVFVRHTLMGLGMSIQGLFFNKDTLYRDQNVPLRLDAHTFENALSFFISSSCLQR